MFRTFAVSLLVLSLSSNIIPLWADDVREPLPFPPTSQGTQGDHFTTQQDAFAVQPVAVHPIATAGDSTVEPAMYQVEKPSRGLSDSMVTVVSSLAIVLGLFAGLIWVLRRTGVGKMSETLNGRLVEVIDRVPFTASQQLQVVRFGQRIILVATSMGNATTIGEMPLSEFQLHQDRAQSPAPQNYGPAASVKTASDRYQNSKTTRMTDHNIQPTSI